MNFKKIYLLVIALLGVASLSAQTQNPVKWTVSSRLIEGKTYEIILEANISGNWHMYDFGPYEGGPNPTTITMGTITGAKMVGKPYMIDKPIRKMDEMFGMEIGYFEKKARFGIKVTLTGAKATLNGNVEWMVCNDQNCMPPDDYDFKVELPAAAPAPAKK